jgi:hypothetical protein
MQLLLQSTLANWASTPTAECLMCWGRELCSNELLTVHAGNLLGWVPTESSSGPAAQQRACIKNSSALF